ncbi:hypothetical protein SNE40_001933 [Patella caerulea]|uniref:Uncharacterized protein n=1 Tax=Patella caerulea TaxID=87958 RepID=A0AAN8Q6W3_PATCE
MGDKSVIVVNGHDGVKTVRKPGHEGTFGKGNETGSNEATGSVRRFPKSINGQTVVNGDLTTGFGSSSSSIVNGCGTTNGGKSIGMNGTKPEQTSGAIKEVLNGFKVNGVNNNGTDHGVASCSTNGQGERNYSEINEKTVNGSGDNDGINGKTREESAKRTRVHRSRARFR